jgi:hypothetical protein
MQQLAGNEADVVCDVHVLCVQLAADPEHLYQLHRATANWHECMRRQVPGDCSLAPCVLLIRTRPNA